MSKVSIIVMGKTGAGKSTLINALLGEHRAQTGVGTAITTKNEIYHTWKHGRQLELLDTVGLELNNSLNRKTLASIEARIRDLSDEYMNEYSDLDEVFMVWYCVNPNNNRFEDFEAEFIKSIRLEYEIPFLIVLTQCWDSDHAENMKREIRNLYPGIPIETVLAEPFKTGPFSIPSYGVDELYQHSISKFNEFKINLLDDKLERVNHDVAMNDDILQRHIRNAKALVEKHAKRAFKIGCIPGVSLVALQAPFHAMYKSVANEFGIKLDEDAVTTIVAIWITGLLTSVILAIPVVAGALAKSLLEDYGKQYVDSIVAVVRSSSMYDLSDSKLMAERINNELKLRKRK